MQSYEEPLRTIEHLIINILKKTLLRFVLCEQWMIYNIMGRTLLESAPLDT